MQISREVFEEQRRPRFGIANPERMCLAFWEWMIRGPDAVPAEEEGVLGRAGLIKRRGILKLSVIRIIVEGELPEDLSLRVAKGIQANVEAAIKRPCVLVRV